MHRGGFSDWLVNAILMHAGPDRLIDSSFILPVALVAPVSP